MRINAILAMRHGDRAAAARSLELVGKHLGLFVDRKVFELNAADDSAEYLQRLMEIVGIKTIDQEPAQQQLERWIR